MGVERSARRERTALRTADAAWLAVVPCALLTVALAALLGPPLGHALLEPRAGDTFWPFVPVRPEPVEHARYLLSLLGPVLLVAAVLAGERRRPHASERAVRAGVIVTQLLLLAFAVLCFAAQYDVLVSAYNKLYEDHVRYFTPPTLAVALLSPPLLLALLRRTSLAAAVARLARETPARRMALLAAALAFTALWLLIAVDADGSLANTAEGVAGHILWSANEAFAVLDGRTPLVDFHSQYSQLWAYAGAGAMALFGSSLGTYTITQAVGCALVLLALFALLRRLTRSSLLALALYMPLVATGFYMKIGPLDDRYAPANLSALWPNRYGGPYVLAWLLARHLDRAAPRRVWPLSLVAGVALINNPEFGVGAVAATAAALLVADARLSRASLRRLLVEGAAGLAAAAALTALLTLVRTGSLPHFGWALEFSRLYGIGGWDMLPMPRIGLYFVVYVTFVAAIAVAVVRRIRDERDVALTAMLMWSGVFGLLAGAYFAGRSHPQVLIDLFSPWALSIALLTIVAMRSLAARGWRPALPELAVLTCFALAVCSLAQTPTPWGQLARIGDDAEVAIFRQPIATRFVRERTRPGEKIVVLIPLGHRVAYEAGRVDVSPYSSMESMRTVQQLQRTLDTLRREGGNKIFLSAEFTSAEQAKVMVSQGYAAVGQVREERLSNIVELVRRR